MGSGWFILDAACFCRKSIGLKLVEEHTKLSSTCMVRVQQTITSHDLTWFARTRRATKCHFYEICINKLFGLKTTENLHQTSSVDLKMPEK